MIADEMTGGDSRDDAEWEWFADAYRQVPEPRPNAVAHAVRAASAWVLPLHVARVALRWILGIATGSGLVIAGHSLVKSGSDHDVTPAVPRISQPRPAAPSFDSVPAMPAEPPKRRPRKPALAPSPEPRDRPEPSPADIARATPAVPDPDTLPTPEDSTTASDILTDAGLSGADLDQLRAAFDGSQLDYLAMLVHLASKADLPLESVLDRARYGVAHGMQAQAILNKVYSRITALYEARDAFDEDATADELSAGADALEAGVDVRQLSDVWSRLPRDRAETGLRVLAGLVADGVPAAAAVDGVGAYTAAGASDSALLDLRAGVAADVARGVPPSDALRDRVGRVGQEP